jgi:hypothetical protein
MLERTQNYEIIKHNFRTYEGSEVVGIVRGESAALSVEKSYTQKLSPEERDAGWTYFIQPTSQEPTIHFPPSPKRKADPFRKR